MSNFVYGLIAGEVPIPKLFKSAKDIAPVAIIGETIPGFFSPEVAAKALTETLEQTLNADGERYVLPSGVVSIILMAVHESDDKPEGKGKGKATAPGQAKKQEAAPGEVVKRKPGRPRKNPTPGNGATPDVTTTPNIPDFAAPLPFGG